MVLAVDGSNYSAHKKQTNNLVVFYFNKTQYNAKGFTDTQKQNNWDVEILCI